MTENIKVYDRESGKEIEIVNICDLLTDLNLWTIDYFEAGRVVMDWASKNDASYYAADRDNFFIWRAVELAISEVHSKAIVEDLS